MSSKLGRIHANWLANPATKLGKMGAWAVWKIEHIPRSGPGERKLWNRMVQFYPELSRKLLGHRVEWWELVECILSDNPGCVVTPHTVMDRADKTEREMEHIIPLKDMVVRVYESVHGGLDYNRSFSNPVKSALRKENDGKCIVCEAPFELNGFNADHNKPYSKGGKSTKENANGLCWRCNSEKSNRFNSTYEYGEYYYKKVGSYSTEAMKKLEERLRRLHA